MNNLNEVIENLHCKYCGKECKNIYSLRQHQPRCKSNPNRIDLSYITGHEKSKVTGYRWVTNGIEQVFTKNFNEYLKLGWVFGMNNTYKEKMSKLMYENKPLG